MSLQVLKDTTNQTLIRPLDYNIDATADYIVERRSSTFYPSGSNVYNATSGTKLIKIVISGDNQYLDPSTLRVQYELVNKTTEEGYDKKLRTIGSPSSFFRRGRLLCGNIVISDVDDYNRTDEMLRMFRPKHVRDNEDIEGFGRRADVFRYIGINDAGEVQIAQEEQYQGIKPRESKTVMFKPIFGLLNTPNNNFIPLKYAPLILEFELVNDPKLPVIDATGMTGGPFKESDCSTDWEIQNVQVKCDLLTLDSQMYDAFEKKIASGHKLKIPFSDYVSQTQVIKGSNVTVNISRAFSELRSVFASLDADHNSEALSLFIKPWNDFYHPMSKQMTFTPVGELEWQLSIGSKIYPDMPVRSLSESWYQL